MKNCCLISLWRFPLWWHLVFSRKGYWWLWRERTWKLRERKTEIREKQGADGVSFWYAYLGFPCSSLPLLIISSHVSSPLFTPSPQFGSVPHKIPAASLSNSRESICVCVCVLSFNLISISPPMLFTRQRLSSATDQSFSKQNFTFRCFCVFVFSTSSVCLPWISTKRTLQN